MRASLPAVSRSPIEAGKISREANPVDVALLGGRQCTDKKRHFLGQVRPKWAYYVVGLEADQVMSVKLDPHNRLKGSLNLLMALAVVLIMLLLFLRMVTFVVGHHQI
jgi:hypothetical protein